MPQPPRVFEPDRLYFITQRTFQSRLFLRPSAALNGIVGGVLARALSLHSVELFAFIIMSNHVHFIMRGEVGQISRFMNYFSGMVGYRVGKLVGWQGKFWHSSYAAAPILDDDALAAKVRYVISHGVKEGLVEHSEEWPGLGSIPELVHGKKRDFAWDDRTAKWDAALRKKQHAIEDKKYPLRLKTLPIWSDYSQEKQRNSAKQALLDGETQGRAMREAQGSLGVGKILAQDPLSQPRATKRGPRPSCHATTAEIREAFLNSRRNTLNSYQGASRRWRDGFIAEFPRGTFRPPTSCEWPLHSPAYTAPDRVVSLEDSAKWIPPGPWMEIGRSERTVIDALPI